ncbi:MAG: cytochrome c biogenesis protein [Desulforhopalus sp.]|jgi:cytochrome c biogenesis protein
MTNLKQLWNFFASVKLAIFTLSSLAITSIIGTVIPQGEGAAFYSKQYGVQAAQFMQILDIPDMYYSWWFLLLLLTLSVNLLVCSVERFPRVWKIIHTDNLEVSPERIAKMPNSKQWQLSKSEISSFDPIAFFKTAGMSPVSKTLEKGTLYFSQKGKYSRTGVYLVHLSILVIFVGALVGSQFGSKGSVMIPELKGTNTFFSSEDSSATDLGFEVRCDKFIIEFYDNGMPKEYQSTLTILENGKEILTKDIQVNSPLTYKGYTFYQSSYQGYQDFIFSITNKKTNESKTTILPFQKQQNWEGDDVRFGIVNAESLGQRVTRTKLWLKNGASPAVLTWLNDNEDNKVITEDNSYEVNVKQMYATGLQIAKDPGVWIVYIGCGLMLIGLYIAFFLSHKRIWLFHETVADGQKLLLGGNSNKNIIDFKKTFSRLENYIEKLI